MARSARPRKRNSSGESSRNEVVTSLARKRGWLTTFSRNGNVGFHAADAEFAQRAVHALASFGQVLAPGGDFHQQRIVVGGKHRAGIRGAAIEANAKSGGRAIGGNAPVIGREILFRVFGGDAALQRGAVERDFFLLRQRKRLFVQLVPLRDENLRAHQVDAGDHFRDGVFHLNARVDFDEIPFLRVDVVQEFDGAGIAIAGMARDLQRRVANLRAHAIGKIRSGRDFDHFLMAALHGAIAFVQMQQVAVLVGENLHFDMARARKIFFQKDGGIAKGRFRFALRFLEPCGQLRGIVNHAHAASAATHRRFHDYGKPDFRSDFLRFFRRRNWVFGSRQYGNAGRSS